LHRAWTQQVGDGTYDVAYGVAVDTRGNVLVAGNTADILPGQQSAGERDVFVRKYDPNGKELWTRQFGSAYGD